MMDRLTARGQEVVRQLAKRFDVSTDAVLTLLEALVRGSGRAAQFTHPELGGPGQWMKGGMTQVGDLFNSALRARVESLCSALSAYLAEEPLPDSDRGGLVTSDHRAAGEWWPRELGSPASAGAQNDARYAYFPKRQRLAIQEHGVVTVYDTLHHQITGFAHQQGTGSASLLLTGPHGAISLSDLPVHSRSTARDRPKAPSTGSAASRPAAGMKPAEAPGEDALALIERLHQLKQMGALTEEEFAAKKAVLLRSV